MKLIAAVAAVLLLANASVALSTASPKKLVAQPQPDLETLFPSAELNKTSPADATVSYYVYGNSPDCTGDGQGFTALHGHCVTYRGIAFKFYCSYGETLVTAISRGPTCGWGAPTTYTFAQDNNTCVPTDETFQTFKKVTWTC